MFFGFWHFFTATSENWSWSFFIRRILAVEIIQATAIQKLSLWSSRKTLFLVFDFSTSKSATFSKLIAGLWQLQDALDFFGNRQKRRSSKSMLSSYLETIVEYLWKHFGHWKIVYSKRWPALSGTFFTLHFSWNRFLKSRKRFFSEGKTFLIKTSLFLHVWKVPIFSHRTSQLGWKLQFWEKKINRHSFCSQFSTVSDSKKVP